MREYVLSNCEKSFVQKLIGEGNRLDGRQYNESRNLKISFGSEWGSCLVSLGGTKVLAQVSCDIVQPKQIRPNEGLLHINVELSPMAAPHFEANRQTDLTVSLSRLLEKCFKDSRSVDLESLCIVVEEKVWNLRVDIRIMNHDGNMMECASIAALAALAHFKRPDVTRSGDTVTVHTVAERDPIPTVLYHYPVCVSFGIFPNDVLISDPSFIEESVCTSSTEDGAAVGGLLVVGMNQYRELCLLNLTGAAMAQSNLVHRATLSAANRCKHLVDTIKSAIVDDDNLRRKRVKVNFGDLISSDGLVSLSKRDLSICLKNYSSAMQVDQETSDSDVMIQDDAEPDSKYKITATKENTAKMETEPKMSKWIEVSSDSEEN